MAIGIIDSGLGGYRIYHALHTHYPQAAFVFLADQKNAPYGNKQPHEILTIARKNMAWFKAQGITTIVIACNTINAVALSSLRVEFPELTFIDVIAPTLDALSSSPIKRWLVVATQLTVQSKMYERELLKRHPDAQVRAVALPQLVSLIEGLADADALTQNLKATLSQEDLAQEGLILGCTHYPLAKANFKAVFKGEIHDSEQAMVNALETVKKDEGLSICVTTGDADFAQTQVKALFHQDQGFSKVDV